MTYENKTVSTTKLMVFFFGLPTTMICNDEKTKPSDLYCGTVLLNNNHWFKIRLTEGNRFIVTDVDGEKFGATHSEQHLAIKVLSDLAMEFVHDGDIFDPSKSMLMELMLQSKIRR